MEAEIVINSPWYRDQIKALDLNTEEGVLEAQRLAFKSIKIDRPKGINNKDESEIVAAYKGAPTAGTFNMNEKNPNVLTVFDSDGEVIFKIVKKQAPPKVIAPPAPPNSYLGRFWGWMKRLFSPGTERNFQGGGIHFHAVGASGEAGAESRSLDILDVDLTSLYLLISNTKFGPTGKATQFDISEIVNRIVSITSTYNEIPKDDQTQNDANVPEMKLDTIQGPKVIDKDGNIGNTEIIRKNGENVDTLFYTPDRK